MSNEALARLSTELRAAPPKSLTELRECQLAPGSSPNAATTSPWAGS